MKRKKIAALLLSMTMFAGSVPSLVMADETDGEEPGNPCSIVGEYEYDAGETSESDENTNTETDDTGTDLQEGFGDYVDIQVEETVAEESCDASPSDIGSIHYNSEIEAYEINSVDNLNDLSVYVNGSGTYSTGEAETDSHRCKNKVFVLTADIDFHPESAWNDTSSTENNYISIGDMHNDFVGIFDGQGHTISGIRIYSESKYQGVFGCISSHGEIRNLVVSNARIIGKDCVGGIVGETYGNYSSTIENCVVGNDVYIGSVSINSRAHGGVLGSNNNPSVYLNGCISSAFVSTTAANPSEYSGLIGTNGYKSVYAFDNLVFGATVNCNRTVSAIIGIKNIPSGTNSNYYLNSTVNGKSLNVGIGWYETNQNKYYNKDAVGANCARTITIPGDLSGFVTFSGTPTFYTVSGITGYADNNVIKYNGSYYSGSGETVTLKSKVDVPSGCHVEYTVKRQNGSTVTVNSNGEFTMPSDNVTITNMKIVGDSNVPVIIDSSIAHGTVTSNKTGAVNGETVTLTVKPDEGYILTSISVSNGEGIIDMPAPESALSAEFGGEPYYSVNEFSFTQGYSASMVTATFMKITDLLHIEMPVTGTKEITIPSGISIFKVYDDGGKNKSYSNYADGYLLLTAPEGYKMHISGRVSVFRWSQMLDYFEAFDGDTGSANSFGQVWVDSASTGSSVQSVPVDFTTSGNHVLLYFYSDESGSADGINLTVTLESTRNVVTGTNVTLGDELGLNFYLDIPEAAVVSGAKAVMNGPKGEQTVLLSSAPKDGDEYKLTYKVNAVQADNDISIKVVDSNDEAMELYSASGSKYENGIKTYSVNRYLVAAMQYEGITDKAPVRATYTYCAYAAKWKYGTGLPDDGYVNELPNPSADVLDAFKVVKINTSSSIKITGYSLVLDSKTAIRLYFTVNDDVQDHVIRVGDNTLTPVLSGSKADGFNEYYVEITGIGAGNLETQYTVVFDQAGDNYQVKLSAMSYVRNVLRQKDKYADICSEELCDLVTAIYAYAEMFK